MQIRSARAVASEINGPTLAYTRRPFFISAWAGMLIISFSIALTGCRDDDDADPENGKPGGRQKTPQVKQVPAVTRNETVYQSGTARFQIMEDGLTDSEREEFFHLTTGGELFPLRWMQNLINPETQAFFLENPGRFGLIPGPPNPDGLPIGLTAVNSTDVRSREKMVGITCSACHTGNITLVGRRLVIVGSASLFDAERFLSELFLSAAKTAETPDMLVNFMHRLRAAEQDQEQLSLLISNGILSHLATNSRARADTTDALRSLAGNAATAETGELLQSFRRRATHTEEEIRSSLLHGFRADVRNVLHEALQALIREPGAATADQQNQAVTELTEDFFIVARLLAGRIAFAGDLAELWTHSLPATRGGPGRIDNLGVTRRLLFGNRSDQPADAPCSTPPLFGLQGVEWTGWDGSTSSATHRNLLTALSWGGVWNPENFSSTVPIANLARLEELAGKLKSPAWPEDVFGRLDARQVETGESVFRAHCAQCHRPDMVNAEDVPHASIYPLPELGTDPLRLQNYLQPLDSRNYSQVLQQTSQAYLDAASLAAGQPAGDAAEIPKEPSDRWQDTDGYVARRLEGIWATAPYLHNGSVPSIRELLLPTAFRTGRFSTYRTEYDPKAVGFIHEVSESHEFIFDTSLPGNSNSGHEYGTRLSSTKKNALLEYLKSL